MQDSLLSLGGMSSIPGITCSRGENPPGMSSTICHGVIQTARSEIPKQLQNAEDIIASGNTTEFFEKGKKIAQILLESWFCHERKVKNLHKRFSLGIKQQDGHHNVPIEVADNPFGQDQPCKMCTYSEAGEHVFTWKIR